MSLVTNEFKLKYGYIIQTIALILLVILFYYLFNNIQYLKTDPCGACAKRLGQSVICSTSGVIRNYDTDGSYTDHFTIVRTDVIRIDSINYTEFALNIKRQQEITKNLTKPK